MDTINTTTYYTSANTNTNSAAINGILIRLNYEYFNINTLTTTTAPDPIKSTANNLLLILLPSDRGKTWTAWPHALLFHRTEASIPL